MSAQQPPNPFGLFIIGSLFAWGAWEVRPWLSPQDQLFYWILAAFATLAFVKLAFLLLLLIPKLVFRYLIMKPTDRAGSAGWASTKEIKKTGLYKRKGVLAGMDGKKPVFTDIESAGLVLSPAGGGKTVSFVVPALCQDPTSMFVPDLKGTLACMTAGLRRKKHGHDILCVNPAGLYSERLGVGARYNPLQILVDDWSAPDYHCQLFANAQAIAKQLCSDPPSQGDNQFWRNGSRKFLIFAFLYLVIIGGYPTLSNALSLLSDVQYLLRALREAAATTHLDGDLARLAKDLLTKFEDGDKKQLESFREGAVQALEVFSPSGSLAESTSYCDFRFSDMRKKKITIYLIADPTRMSVYAPWLGLLAWCALTELIRYQNNRPVCFLLDEVTNFKIEGLPSMLTLAREFKIKIWLIVQELEQWAQVYGRESLETLLSQTEVKIIMGSRSFKTCQLISNMLGQTTIKTKNYNLGRTIFDETSSSVQDTARPLLTADEVRRTKKTILFVRDLKPIEVDKIGYHEIKPYSKWVAPNPLFAKKLKGKTRLRL